jgi:hypothetical protein
MDQQAIAVNLMAAEKPKVQQERVQIAAPERGSL